MLNDKPKSLADAGQQMLLAESDRGSVLVGVALLDEALERALRRFFDNAPHVVKHGVTPLFQAMGPLSTFSAKIKIAYALQLVSKKIFRDLERMRGLRNSFAHNHKPVDMLDPVIAAEIALLETGAEKLSSLKRYDLRDSSAGHSPPAEAAIEAAGYVKYSKSRFVLCVCALITYLERIRPGKTTLAQSQLRPQEAVDGA